MSNDEATTLAGRTSKAELARMVVALQKRLEAEVRRCKTMEDLVAGLRVAHRAESRRSDRIELDLVRDSEINRLAVHALLGCKECELRERGPRETDPSEESTVNVGGLVTNPAELADKIRESMR